MNGSKRKIAPRLGRVKLKKFLRALIKGTFYSLVGVLFISACGQTATQPPPETPAKAYRFQETLVVNGLTRSYTLNLPPNYYDANNFSLVIALHGGGGSAEQFETTSKLTDKANASGFIVVYPEGVQSTGILGARSWNAGNCCDYASDNNIPDVAFIMGLIEKLSSTYKIKPEKVYATGHSNGGMLAYRLACELSGKIAAIAPNSSTMVVNQPCNPSRGVPILHMHSVLDTHVPYEGGMGTKVGTRGVYLPPLADVLSEWSAKNTCKTPAQVVVDDSRYKLTKWLNCNNNASLEYYLTQDGGHGWPGGLPGGPNSDIPATSINANDLLWDFFQQHELSTE
jgi:polyhydroxybutyrate depolymerase